MKKYLIIAKGRILNIPNFAIEAIPRNDNQLTDFLSKLAFGATKLRVVHFLERAFYSVVENQKEVFNIQAHDNLTTTLYNLWKNGILLEMGNYTGGDSQHCIYGASLF